MANPDRSHSKKTLTHDDLDLLVTHLLNKLVVRASQSIEPKPEPEPEPSVEDQKPVGFNCTHCGRFNAFPAKEIDPEVLSIYLPPLPTSESPADPSRNIPQNRMSPFVTGVRGAIHKKYKSEKAAVTAWWSAKAVGGVSLLFQ
ncbi:hypothetical protein BD779DRAFT_1680795 [Infundibulicybe gibba]|nr:hypothetical protein BD779DRAFT_1680795 [Infundibulicybe gibba]